MSEPIRDKDGREVSVSDTGSRTTLGIHSWSMAWGHSAMTPEQEAPSRSIFLTLVNAKMLCSRLEAEIAYMEGGPSPVVEREPIVIEDSNQDWIRIRDDLGDVVFEGHPGDVELDVLLSKLGHAVETKEWERR